MNKVEYLEALKVALKNTDKEIMEEIISDYEEHFQVGVENGKTEEQICEDLGSIEDLVSEIKEVYGTDKKSEKKDKKEEKKEENSTDGKSCNKGKFFADWNFNFDNITGESISNVINNALNTAGEALSNLDVKELGENVKKGVEEAASILNSFADDYLKNQGNPFDRARRNAEGSKENTSKSYDDSTEPDSNQKEECKTSFEFDVNFSEESKEEASETMQEEETSEITQEEQTSETTQEEETTKEAVTSEISETAQETEETVESEEPKQESQNQMNLVIDGICADVKIVKSSNGKININYENNGSERQKSMYEFYSYKEGNTVYAGIRKVGRAVFFFNFASNSIVIHVEVPENMGSINIRTASGDVIATNVCADQMIAETASGDIHLREIHATDVKAKSASGNIDLCNINAIQLFGKTMSGNVSNNQVEAKNLTLKSSSGDVDCRELKTDILDVSSLSGDVNLLHIKVSEGKVRSTSGEVTVNDVTMNNVDISSVSGNVKVTNAIGDGLRAASTSGNVSADVNVKRCHASSKSGNVNVICNGDLSLEANSTSGNVNVNLKNYGNGYNIKTRTTSGGLYINYADQHLRNLKTGTYTYGKESTEMVLGSISGDIHVNE